MNDDDNNIHTLRAPHPDFDPDNPLRDEPAVAPDAAAEDVDGNPVLDHGDDVTASALGASRFDTDVEDSPDTAAPGAGRSWPLPKVLVVAAAVGIFGYVAYSTLVGGQPAAGTHHASNMPRMGMTLTSAPAPAPSPAKAPTAPALHQASPPPTAGATGFPAHRSPATPAMTEPVSNALSPSDRARDTYPSVAPPAPASAASAALVATVTALKSQVSQLETQIQKLREVVGREPVRRSGPRPAAPVHRHVASTPKPKPARTPAVAKGGPILKAVLVGQAWFQLKSGTTITVGVGGTVPKYGRVTAIDANAGTVRFASGVVAK